MSFTDDSIYIFFLWQIFKQQGSEIIWVDTDSYEVTTICHTRETNQSCPGEGKELTTTIFLNMDPCRLFFVEFIGKVVIHHQDLLTAQTPLTNSNNPSLSSIAFGESSRHTQVFADQPNTGVSMCRSQQGYIVWVCLYFSSSYKSLVIDSKKSWFAFGSSYYLSSFLQTGV